MLLHQYNTLILSGLLEVSGTLKYQTDNHSFHQSFGLKHPLSVKTLFQTVPNVRKQP